VDKTGTLTQNLMKVNHIYDFFKKQEINFEKDGKASEVLEYAMWASEETPFDPMEKSIHEKFGIYTKDDQRGLFKIIKEFPLSGKPPVMIHIFGNEQGDRIFACKGALEGVVRLCNLNAIETEEALSKGQEYAKKGLRVLGVAKGTGKKHRCLRKRRTSILSFLAWSPFTTHPTNTSHR
jgi:Ca2+-transporting ATPase